MSERLRGNGKVFHGNHFIAEVHYEIDIDSVYKTSRTLTSESTLLVREDVSLRISPARAIASQFGVDRLTLHMSDGRKQGFFVSSDSGDCSATGGPNK
jgi:hypothetical protein